MEEYLDAVNEFALELEDEDLLHRLMLTVIAIAHNLDWEVQLSIEE